MISLLQKMGIVEKDAEAPAAVVEPVAEDIVISTKRPSSLIDSMTRIQAHDGSDTPDVVINEDRVLELVSILENGLAEQSPVLVDVHEFMATATKLTRITDPRAKYLSTLDITGKTAEEVLQSAGQYSVELKSLAGKIRTDYTGSGEAARTELRNLKDELDRTKTRLLEELAQVDAQIEAHNEAWATMTNADEQELACVDEAETRLDSGFLTVFNQMQTHLK